MTNLHVGSGSPNDCVDLPVVRDGEGSIFIPGTSVAGALRGNMEELQKVLGWEHRHGDPTCDCPACAIFGSSAPSEYVVGARVRLVPSHVWVYDSYVVSEGGNTREVTTIRDHVGIDRVTSAAAHHAKYNKESVLAGTEFSFRLAVESDMEHWYMLAAVLEEWKCGRGFIGGGKSIGFGKVEIVDLRVFRLDLSSIEKLLDYLESDSIAESAEPSFLSEEPDWLPDVLLQNWNNLVVDSPERVFVELDLELSVDGGVVVSDIISQFDEKCAVAPIKQDKQYVIPGSSLRGMLRAQAERISRTMATNASNGIDDYLERCPACHPFNLSTSHEGSCESGYRARLGEGGGTVDLGEETCLACRFFGMTHLGSRLSISDGFVEDFKSLDKFNFVAIDRFTGGGLDTALFDAAVLMFPKFTTRILLEHPMDWELGWLLLVIRDIQDGLLSVGWGKSKGFGRLRLEKMRVRELWTVDKSEPISARRNGVFVVKNEYDSFTRLWNDMSSLYLNALHQALSAHEWKLRNGTDSYFNRRIEDTLFLSDLYPKGGSN
ncbi:MAG: RAMP superfamily CRISPR-associated protein [Candidatus Thorarchaeota archaeon]